MNYIMLDIDGVLTGTINVDLTLSEQALWFRALCLAGRGHGRVGFIERGVGVPYSKESLYHAFGCLNDGDRNVLDKMLAVCLDGNDPRMRYDESGCIEIIKWDKYQYVPKGSTRSDVKKRKEDFPKQ